MKVRNNLVAKIVEQRHSCLCISLCKQRPTCIRSRIKHWAVLLSWHHSVGALTFRSTQHPRWIALYYLRWNEFSRVRVLLPPQNSPPPSLSLCLSHSEAEEMGFFLITPAALAKDACYVNMINSLQGSSKCQVCETVAVIYRPDLYQSPASVRSKQWVVLSGVLGEIHPIFPGARKGRDTAASQ